MLPLMCTLNTSIDYMITYVMSSYLHWPFLALFGRSRGSTSVLGLFHDIIMYEDLERLHDATWLTDLVRIPIDIYKHLTNK